MGASINYRDNSNYLAVMNTVAYIKNGIPTHLLYVCSADAQRILLLFSEVLIKNPMFAATETKMWYLLSNLGAQINRQHRIFISADPMIIFPFRVPR